MRLLKTTIALFVVTLFLSGCVSTKKYNELELVKDHYKLEYDKLYNQKNDTEALRAELEKSKHDHKETMRALEDMTVRYQRKEKDYQNLLANYNQLLEQNKSILSTSSYEKQSLQERLAAKEKELDAKSKELEALNYSLKEKEDYLNTLQTELTRKGQRIEELQKHLTKKDEQLAQLKASIQQALIQFSEDELTIEEKDGKIYVSLSQDLLFKSGSSTLDFKGKKAIHKLGKVLSSNKSFGILVEGHTDSDGTPESNWDLSVKRAATVTKELIKGGVNPTRITAAGRSFYHPVAENDTAENKAKNRRTEIILEPDLNKLYELLK